LTKTLRERTIVDLSNESLLVIIGVGVAAGWLGTGFGLLSDMAIGIVGALVGDWVLPRLNVQLGVGIAALIINAVIGAIPCCSSSRSPQAVQAGAAA
jgi:uncharacterized membrane protein YeaQ/YmgE (transglycosylase-associated protein family)